MAARPAGKGSGAARSGKAALVRSLDPAELLARAASDGQAPPLLLVSGDDVYSRDAVLADLRRLLVPEGFEGFNAAALDADSMTAEEIIRQAEMLPFGGGRRFLLLRRADRIREKDAEKLIGYAAQPVPSTCLALVFDQKAGLLPSLAKSGAALIDFAAPRDYQLSRWLDAQARRLRIALDPDAARALAELSGGNFVAAMSELQKAALNAPGRGKAGPRVTRLLVEELAARGTGANPFHLADAVLSREPSRAIGILRNLMDAGDTGFEILGRLESQLRRFLEMREAVSTGQPARLVVQEKSPTLPPDVRARITRQLEHFDEPRLMDAFRIARQTDRAIKGHGSGSVEAHLESLVWRIAAL